MKKIHPSAMGGNDLRFSSRTCCSGVHTVAWTRSSIEALSSLIVLCSVHAQASYTNCSSTPSLVLVAKSENYTYPDTLGGLKGGSGYLYSTPKSGTDPGGGGGLSAKREASPGGPCSR